MLSILCLQILVPTSEPGLQRTKSTEGRAQMVNSKTRITMNWRFTISTMFMCEFDSCLRTVKEIDVSSQLAALMNSVRADHLVPILQKVRAIVYCLWLSLYINTSRGLSCVGGYYTTARLMEQYPTRACPRCSAHTYPAEVTYAFEVRINYPVSLHQYRLWLDIQLYIIIQSWSQQAFH